MSDFDPSDYVSLSDAVTEAQTDDQRREAVEYWETIPEYKTGRKDAISSGAKVRGKVKRGNDTRDQDELVIEGRGATAAEAADDFEAALSKAEANEWTQRLRDLQPSEGDE